MRNGSQGMKGKSMSTPPLPMTGMGNHTGRVEKKGSDPTPLRQSVRRVESGLETVESPASFDPDSASYPHDDSSLDVAGASGSYKPPSRSSTLPPTHPLATSSTSSASRSLTPSASLPPTGPSSASSSTSHLSVPIARDFLPNQSATIPTPMERSGSQITTSAKSTHSGSAASSLADQASLGVRNGDRPPALRRVRSISGASLQTSQLQTSKGKPAIPLSGRRGVTQGRSLKSHTCTWDHDLQLALRIPISKERNNSSTPTGSASGKVKINAPLLGEGPESASGLQLIIEQLPTSSATATASSHSKTGEMGIPSHTPSRDGPHEHSSVRSASTSTPTPTTAHSVKGERTVFGKVDIDLAAFAGKGKTTRKFLLGGSRTNATIKLTVDMSWVGGDENWVA